jgi:L,D-transpeptidase YbiS
MQYPSIHISVSRQTLTLRGPDFEERHYPISTSRYGLGSEPGSFRTPIGQFEVAEKIGDGAQLGAIFKARVPTGRIGDPASPDDLIQTRILWLHGLDPNNRNTMDRYIYIHGTNHEDKLGTPVSHGCVRMANAGIAELFDFVSQGTPVEIHP